MASSKGVARGRWREMCVAVGSSAEQAVADPAAAAATALTPDLTRAGHRGCSTDATPGRACPVALSAGRDGRRHRVEQRTRLEGVHMPSGTWSASSWSRSPPCSPWCRCARSQPEAVRRHAGPRLHQSGRLRRASRRPARLLRPVRLPPLRTGRRRRRSLYRLGPIARNPLRSRSMAGLLDKATSSTVIAARHAAGSKRGMKANPSLVGQDGDPLGS